MARGIGGQFCDQEEPSGEETLQILNMKSTQGIWVKDNLVRAMRVAHMLAVTERGERLRAEEKGERKIRDRANKIHVP